MATQTFLAYYAAPIASDSRASGVFEFQSENRKGTKANIYDARMEMLKLYGKDAVSWNIEKVERKTASKTETSGQLTLDFRPPKPEKKRGAKKEYW